MSDAIATGFVFAGIGFAALALLFGVMAMLAERRKGGGDE